MGEIGEALKNSHDRLMRFCSNEERNDLAMDYYKKNPDLFLEEFFGIKLKLYQRLFIKKWINR